MDVDVEADELQFCCGFEEVGPFETGWPDSPWTDGVEIHEMSPSQLKSYKKSVKKFFYDLSKGTGCAAFLVTLNHHQDKILGGFFSRTLGFTKVVSGLHNGNSGNKVSLFVKPNPRHKGKNKKAKINRIRF